MESVIKELISEYDLAPLEHEGGYFKQVMLTPSFSVIYYLMTGSSFSALHILEFDEIWTFIKGDPIEQITICKDKNVSLTTVGETGRDSGVNLIHSNVWQGSRIKRGGTLGYALCTATCIPSYRQEGFRLATQEALDSIANPKDFLLVREFLAD